MYIRSTKGLGDGYLTDYDATLAQWLAGHSTLGANPNASAAGNAATDFTARHSTSGINPNLAIGAALENDNASKGVMCSQVMKRCPDGSLVGYDLKVKNACVYLPCPVDSSEEIKKANDYEKARLAIEPAKGVRFNETDWEFMGIFGVYAIGALGLAYMLFRK